MLPVLGTTIRAIAHTPDLVPEIVVSMSMAVMAIAVAHLFYFDFFSTHSPMF